MGYDPQSAFWLLLLLNAISRTFSSPMAARKNKQSKAADSGVQSAHFASLFLGQKFLTAFPTVQAELFSRLFRIHMV